MKGIEPLTEHPKCPMLPLHHIYILTPRTLDLPRTPNFRDIIYSSLVHFFSEVLGCVCIFILVAFLVYYDTTLHFKFSLVCDQLRVATPKDAYPYKTIMILRITLALPSLLGSLKTLSYHRKVNFRFVVSRIINHLLCIIPYNMLCSSSNKFLKL